MAWVLAESKIGSVESGSTADGIVDSSYNLAGVYRTNWLGKRGAERAVPE